MAEDGKSESDVALPFAAFIGRATASDILLSIEQGTTRMRRAKILKLWRWAPSPLIALLLVSPASAGRIYSLTPPPDPENYMEVFVDFVESKSRVLGVAAAQTDLTTSVPIFANHFWAPKAGYPLDKPGRLDWEIHRPFPPVPFEILIFSIQPELDANLMLVDMLIGERSGPGTIGTAPVTITAAGGYSRSLDAFAQQIPEPGGLSLGLAGSALLAACRRRKERGWRSGIPNANGV
jgi:hypothetical protein